jgi:hypothetical protein
MIQKTKKNLASSKWAIEIIFSLYRGGRMKIFPLPTFCSYVRKKKGKNNKTNLSLRVKWSVQTYNLQHTTTMHKWGQVQKREKSFYWHTSWQLQKPNCMSSLPPFTPLNSGCL